MTEHSNAHCERLIETNVNHSRKHWYFKQFFPHFTFVISIASITLIVYLYQLRTFGRILFVTQENVTTHLSHVNYPFHPSIWIIGMLNQRTPQSLCDYKKTTLAYQMFWSELLFDEQVWIIDHQSDSIRRAQTNYQYFFPYPKFYISKPSMHVLHRMKRINAHTHMRTAEYEFQQWSTFYFDIYAINVANMYSIPQPQILAIVDGDSQLQTFPTFESVFPEISFNDVIRSNRNANHNIKQFKLRAFGVGIDMFSAATQILLRKPQIADFMVTFPVYVYLDTLTNMRNYIEKLHNMSFDDAFEKSVIKSRTYYSQFAIILTYAYWFEPERYSFHIQPWPNNKLDKFYSDLVPNSIPQPRVSLHIKENPKQAIMKGCCFSYQLKDTIINNSLSDVFTDVNRTKIKELCNSFGDYENHYEATCDHFVHFTDPDMHIWKKNDTMSIHYRAVARDIQYLSNESRNKKIMACINYLTDPNPENWFPHSNNCTLL